ncbi:hypothetical protein DXG01_007568 [Tephrocybe rancida]|nr:hypothetical protein DXG01_007568 [Tephrocybe rancida]
MATFYTPAYYASQLIPVLQIIQSEPVFGGQDIEMGHRNVRDVDIETGATIPHLAPPEDVHIGTDLLPLEWVGRLSSRPRTNAHGPIISDSATRQQVESRWTIFVEHRCREWYFLVTGAGALLLASPALLQIPGTNGDPVVRGFIYFLISCFGTVVASAMVLMYYFHKSRFRSARFAMFWCQVGNLSSTSL